MSASMQEIAEKGVPTSVATKTGRKLMKTATKGLTTTVELLWHLWPCVCYIELVSEVNDHVTISRSVWGIGTTANFSFLNGSITP